MLSIKQAVEQGKLIELEAIEGCIEYKALGNAKVQQYKANYKPFYTLELTSEGVYFWNEGYTDEIEIFEGANLNTLLPMQFA